MWIETTNRREDGTLVVPSFKEPWMDSPVEFNDNGKAQVSKEVGERLLDERDDIVESGSTDTETTMADEDDESDEAVETEIVELTEEAEADDDVEFDYADDEEIDVEEPATEDEEPEDTETDY